jgi:hypothetical protein
LEHTNVFIDFDNVLNALMNFFAHSRSEAQSKTLTIIGDIGDFLGKRGVVATKCSAYCDWSRYPDAVSELYNMGVETVHVRGIPGNNSSNIELSLSVLEEIFRSPMQVIAVVAGDRDYMPVASRVKEWNKTLLIISFRETLSEDLKSLLGADSVSYIDPRSGQVMVSDWQQELTPKAVSTEVAEVEYSSELSHDQVTALRASIEAIDSVKPKSQTFRTEVFLLTYLATRLNHLTYVQRKEVFSSLVKRGYLAKRPDYDMWGAPYSAYSVKESNDVVKKLREAMKSEVVRQPVRESTKQ